MSNISEITEIFGRCIKGTATKSELAVFYEWAELPENHDQATKLLESAFSSAERTLDMDAATGESIFEAILNASKNLVTPTPYPPPVHRIYFLKTAWFRYAAVLLVIAGAAAYFFYHTDNRQSPTSPQQAKNETPIVPGGNKATLTLADGSTIVLDSAANGNLAQQGTTKIQKLHAGSLAYNAGTSSGTGELLYNTISTPRGGQYQITLPDGTKVWMNAVSSIRFPTAFIKERKVSVKGEVYMEVANDKTKPFIVDVDGKSSVTVLGTSFNINAYNDEPAIKTTLLEGRIRISAPIINKQTILTPGQQASITNDQLSVINNQSEAAIAWKKGLFNFNGSTLKEFMRQLARWYDLDVVYPEHMPVITFEGTMGRDLALADVLDILTQFKISYKMEKRRLIIK